MRIITFLLHAYLYLSIFEFLVGNNSGHYKWIFVMLFGLIKYLTVSITFTRYFLPLMIVTLLVFYGKFIHREYSYLQFFKHALITYGIDLVLSIVMGSICGIIGGVFEIEGKNWTYVSTVVGTIIVIFLLNRRKIQLEKAKQKWVLYIVVVVSVVVVFVEQILSIAYKTQNNSFVYIGVSCVYVAVLFTALWLLDHYKMLKIQNEYAADNKQMSQKLHRSKEVLPLIADYVANIDDTEDEVMRQKLAEVCHDYGKELSNEELKTGLFNTTGIPMLDLMFQKKMKECAAKDIEFNVFVSTRIDEDMKRLGVNDGELLRIMGDLLRNAMNAVEEAHDSPDSMILAVVARDELGHVEFHVHDSGVPFSDEVLEKLGERGVTTWGTGNGMADLIETLRRVHASMEIIPEPDMDDLFTKEIVIRFDGEGLLKTKNGQASA